MLRNLALFVLLLPVLLVGQNDRSLSPYFIVNVDSGETVPDFPLQLTSADVEIAGVIADVTITQVYTNHSSRPLEAVYVFSGSTNAAVYAMEMQIGRRTITAEIRERDQARQEYTEAKESGKTVSLLEQQRPNIFTMNVANVMPGDSIIVRMSYTERLIPTNGVYEFVYPTVVGPRYTGTGAPDIMAGNNSGILPSAEGIPYTEKGTAPSFDFNISVSVSSCLPFEFIQSTSHKVLLSFEEKNTAKILLDPAEKNSSNRDFILQYRFAGGQIETGLMLYEGKEENFFMLMMQPPKRVPLDSIPPREYIFVMDVSGSMAGYPLETSKELMRNLVGGLRPTDKFNIIQFAGGGAMLSNNSMYATAENLDSAITFINVVRAGGGTELNNAMRMAMAIPKQQDYSRSIVVVTDGFISAEAAVLKSMRAKLDSANVFTFGIGSSTNRYLIEAMAFCGNGEPFVVTQANEADSAAERFRRYISSPVLTNIKIRYEGFDAYEAEPRAVPDLFAERPLVITGKYRGKPTGKIIVDGSTGTGAYHKEISLDSVRPNKQNKAIRLLWARDRVKYLSYLDNPGAGNYWYGTLPKDTTAKTEILNLGLKYGILTNYTSFIAVDRRVRNKDAENDSTIVQPLPLPAGVENSAIGFTNMLMLNSVVTASAVSACYSIVTVDACYASVLLLPIRPDVPGNSMSTQDPISVGDLNWNFNGGYIAPVISNRYQPFFSPGASARMTSGLPLSMINSYSFGPANSDQGMHLFAPANSASIGFNLWWYGRNQLTVSGTHRGAQNLYFAHEWQPNESKFNSLLEISEEWRPVQVDRNNDDYMDVPTGLGASLHHRLSYSPDSYDSTALSSATNDLFFHTSSFTGGQINGNYQTVDKAIGIYAEPRLLYHFRANDYLRVDANFGYASMENEFGVDRFQLQTTMTSMNAQYEISRGIFSYEIGLAGSMCTGEERWNTIRLSSDYNAAAGNFSFVVDKDLWRITTTIIGNYDDVNGGILLPMAQLSFYRESWAMGISGRRYRSVPFTMGQLLPLFYSSRDLDMSSGRGANQGWYLTANTNIWMNKVHAFVDYSLSIPEHSVIVNTDADANKILVYGVNGGPSIHRVRGKLDIDFTDYIQMTMEYLATIYRYNYDGVLQQQPLLPKHKAFMSLDWRSRNGSMKASAQVCYTGSQRLPQHGWTEDYITANILLHYTFRDRYEVFANGFNLLDYRQKSVIMESDTGGFDGWMVWAPVTGRTFQFGVTMKF